MIAYWHGFNCIPEYWFTLAAGVNHLVFIITLLLSFPVLCLHQVLEHIHELVGMCKCALITQ